MIEFEVSSVIVVSVDRINKHMVVSERQITCIGLR